MILAKTQPTTVLVLLIGVLTFSGESKAQDARTGGPVKEMQTALEPPRLERLGQPTSEEGQRVGVDRYGDPVPEMALARLGTVRLRHSGEPTSVDVSPDGTLTVSNAGVWDTATGQELDRFKGKIRGQVVAFSPDGKVLLLFTGSNGLVQQWDVATGKLLHQSDSPRPAARDDFHGSVAVFSRDRKFLALCDGRTAILQEVATGKRPLRLQKEQGMMSIAISHDANLLATGGQDSFVYLWNVATGKELCALKGHGDWIYAVNFVHSLCFSPDDKLLASAAYKDLRLWDVATGQQLWQIPYLSGRIAFSPDGNLLACGSKDTIHLLDARTGKETRRLKEHGSWTIPTLAFSRDGKMLVSGGRDHTVRIWDVATGKPLHWFEGHQGAVICLAFSPDGRSLASGGKEDPTLIVWDLATRKPKRILRDHSAWVSCAAYSPDGKVLATGEGFRQNGGEAQIRLWDASDGKLVRQFFGHLINVQSLSFSPDRKALASAGGDARVRLWDVSTGMRLQQIRGAEYNNRAIFSSDGKALLTTDSQGVAALWDGTMGRKLCDLGPAVEGGHWVSYATFLPDGATVFTVGVGTALVHQPQRPPQRERFTQASFSDRSTGRLLHSFRLASDERFSGTNCSALSPDGKTLATGERDGSIQLWDPSTGKGWLQLPGHTGYVSSLAFSPDGKTLASGSWDTTVLLWNLSRCRLQYVWLQALRASDSAPHEFNELTTPEKAVSFLVKRLQRDTGLEGQVKRLIADLDDGRFAVREKAWRELEKLGPAAGPSLRAALAGKPSPEARRRMELLLSLKKPEVTSASTASRLLATLAELGISGAREALQERAKGPEETPVSHEAKAALDRLAKPSTAEGKGP